jgi:hypothetical protein
MKYASRLIKNFCISLFCLIVSAMILGAGYQFVSTKIDERNYPPPGKMVDVGGYRLHIKCSGKDAHGPTVVLEAGLGCNSLDWALIQFEESNIKQFSRLFLTYSDHP